MDCLHYKERERLVMESSRAAPRMGGDIHILSEVMQPFGLEGICTERLRRPKLVYLHVGAFPVLAPDPSSPIFLQIDIPALGAFPGIETEHRENFRLQKTLSCHPPHLIIPTTWTANFRCFPNSMQ
jgi:hypothetical protein